MRTDRWRERKGKKERGQGTEGKEGGKMKGKKGNVCEMIYKHNHYV